MSSLCGCSGANSHVTPEIYALNFNFIPNNFDIKKENIIEHIKEIDDPLLQQVSLYLSYYYQQGHAHFSKCPTRDNRTTACQYLNKWSWHIKNIYTCSEKCTKKNELWSTYIDKLWDLLKTNFTDENNIRNTPWCYRFINPSYNKTPIPEKLVTIFDNNVNKYSNSVSTHPSSTMCEKPSDSSALPDTSHVHFPSTDKCTCPEESPKILAQQSQPSPEKSNPNYFSDLNYYIVLSSAFTFFGTISFFFLLYKFTPLKSWIIRSNKSKNGIDRYINEETDEFLNTYENSDMPTKNRRNHLFYHSMED
ncbi:PIR Superfamily Protein [Plasmodium ovale curtisi]|uniref:PIR Superfamily Protein n=1 Tax=Plasmodium ovale curtisi TaxID=864141 RepID=A0A1A8WD16_PLAOA|nr:PIR Superfamily Protein [Plasmodium ovale curtisi]SBT01869.1 PIR Superfamily Protein [Plasmodium ovale curtisi]